MVLGSCLSSLCRWPVAHSLERPFIFLLLSFLSRASILATVFRATRGVFFWLEAADRAELPTRAFRQVRRVPRGLGPGHPGARAANPAAHQRGTGVAALGAGVAGDDPTHGPAPRAADPERQGRGLWEMGETAPKKCGRFGGVVGWGDGCGGQNRWEIGTKRGVVGAVVGAVAALGGVGKIANRVRAVAVFPSRLPVVL